MNAYVCTFLCLCLLQGCMATPPPKPSEPAPATTYTPPAPLTDLTYPSSQKTYWVGRQVDPNNPAIMTGGQYVHVQTQPERWNVQGQGLPSNAGSGPVLASGSTALHPGLVPAEYEQMLAKADSVIKDLAKQNEALANRTRELTERINEQAQSTNAAKVMGLPTPTPALAQAVNPAPPVVFASSPIATTPNPEVAAPAVAPRLPGNQPLPPNFIVLVPNSDGFIEMDLALLDPPGFADENPFIKKYKAKGEQRQLEARVSSTALGPSPTAVLNRRLISLGESWEGFHLYSIDSEGIYLRRDTFLLRIPITSKPILIKLP